MSEFRPGSGDAAHVLAVALKAANLGVWQWDLVTGTFEYSNRAKEIFGFPADAPVSRQMIVNVMHPADHPVAREQAARSLDPAITKREPYLYRIFRAQDRALRWIQAFGEPVFEDRDGSPVAVRYVGTLQDVTDEVEAREKLAREEARLRMAIEASGLAVWELDLADGTVSHSPELNRMCGFPPDARPTLAEFRSRYAPGERERIEIEGAEIRARGGTSINTEIRHIWPDGTEKWLAMRAQMAPGETGYGGRVIGVVVDVTDQKLREQQQELLLGEFEHRIKNAFAVMQTIISQTLRGEEVAEGVKTKLQSRLKAMASAHTLVAEAAWQHASLLAVLDEALEAFDGRRTDKVTVSGADVQLSPRAALSFALVFHELITNASKYGAFRSDSGRLAIDLSVEEEPEPRLRLRWLESGVQLDAGEHRTGFGTKLVERVVAAELGASVSRELRADGLRLEFAIPMRNLMG